MGLNEVALDVGGSRDGFLEWDEMEWVVMGMGTGMWKHPEESYR